MRVNAFITDEFYSNVDEVRQFIRTRFQCTRKLSSPRTKSFLNDSVKQVINDVISPRWAVIFWGDEEYTGSYQFTTSRDRSWIHCDQTTRWAGVCFLTPNAPLSSGTGIFKHKPTGLIECPRLENGETDRELLDKIYKDSQDYTKWELVDKFANIYNRHCYYLI